MTSQQRTPGAQTESLKAADRLPEVDSTSQQAIVGGIDAFTEIHQELGNFAQGRGTPNWTALVTRFGAQLDQMRQACYRLGWSPGP